MTIMSLSGNCYYVSDGKKGKPWNQIQTVPGVYSLTDLMVNQMPKRARLFEVLRQTAMRSNQFSNAFYVLSSYPINVLAVLF